MDGINRPIAGSGLAVIAALLLQASAVNAQEAAAQDAGAEPEEAPAGEARAEQPAASPSREEALEARVAALEERLAASGEREPQGIDLLGNESNPSMSLILDVAAGYFSQEYGDRVHSGGHAPTGTGIGVTGAELAASANVDPYFRLDMAFCFSHLHLEEITFTTLALPGNLQVRGGLFLSKVGRVNNTHPHSWHFVMHPLPNQFLFGAEGLGAPGVELSWLAPLPWYVELTGALQIGEGGAFRTKDLGDGDPGFRDFLYPLRLAQFFDLADDWALQAGANAVFAPSAMGPEVGNRAYAYGGDLLLKWRPIGAGDTGYASIALVVEGWYRELEVPNDLWRDAGGYADLIFGIAKRWEAAARGELWRRLDGDAPGEDNGRAKLGLDVERASGSVSFLPTHFSRIRLQYTFENVEGYEPNHIAVVQLEVSAGAHGAHAY